MRLLIQAWSLSLLALCADCAASPQAPHDSLSGSWRGSAVFRRARLDFSVRFVGDGSAWRAFLSSPDLLLLDQPLDSVRLQALHVGFVTRDERPLRFDGVLRGDSIRGTAPMPAVPGVLDLRGAETPALRFVLHRGSAPAAPPYTTREVRFKGAGIQLAGTLFVPVAGRGRHPGIVILQGSSSNLREEYRFYADHFARAGLAVLAFDKRGKGESSGDYEAATYSDLAADAAAAVQFLRAQPRVAPEKVGVWGLSQGAFIAPLVAARVPSLAFIVAVSPPGISIGETSAYQDSVRLRSSGFPPMDAARAAALNRKLLTWLRTDSGAAPLAAELSRAADTPWRRASALPASLPTGSALQGWYWRGRTLDPAPHWHALRTPVLVVFGGADELLPAALSAARIEQALRQGANPDFTVRVFPAANHVLRELPLVAGGAWDWPRAASGYMDLVTRWVLERD